MNRCNIKQKINPEFALTERALDSIGKGRRKGKE
jgi:hypothetical protein